MKGIAFGHGLNLRQLPREELFALRYNMNAEINNKPADRFSRNMLETFNEYYSECLSEKIKAGIKVSKGRKLKNLEKLKGKQAMRLDVLAQLSEAQRRVIFDNMGVDFEDWNNQVLTYQKELKVAVAELFS